MPAPASVLPSSRRKMCALIATTCPPDHRRSPARQVASDHDIALPRQGPSGGSNGTPCPEYLTSLVLRFNYSR
jgi:hypothetical protein